MKTWLVNYSIKGQRGVQQTEISGADLNVSLAIFRLTHPEIVRITKHILVKENFKQHEL